MPPEHLAPITANPHVLQPHHIALVAFIVITFRIPTPPSKPWSSAAYLHALRLLIDEIAEVAAPRHINRLLVDITHGHPVGTDHYTMAESLQKYCQYLREPGALTSLFDDLFNLIVLETDELPNAPIERRSYLGIFCRRCHLSYSKLSFEAVVTLQNTFWNWCQDSTSTTGYKADDIAAKDVRRSMIFPTTAERKEKTQKEPFKKFEMAIASGDHSVASEALRRFFDQDFQEVNVEAGLLQHALLNLARYHFIWGHDKAARKVLAEAIAVARTNGDKQILEHCMSLLRRFPVVHAEHELEPAGQTSLSPLDMLWHIGNLVETEQPLSICFAQIYQAIGTYDWSCSTQEAIFQPSPTEQFAQHAVQSILWSYAGSERLAEIEENIVIAFTEKCSNEEIRFKTLCSKARRAARQGKLEAGLSLLLDPGTWAGLSIQQYQDWSREVRQMLILDAQRRGQNHRHQAFFEARWNKSCDFRSQELPHATAQPHHKDGTSLNSLHWGAWYQRQGETSSSLHSLLNTLWATEFVGHFGRYRTAIILFADLCLDLGAASKSLSILEALLSQVINGNDLEQRAYACFTLARALIVTGRGDDTSLKAALPYLQLAEEDYSKLLIIQALEHVQGFIATVCDRLGMISERDAAAERHNATLTEISQGYGNGRVSEDVKIVWNLVEAVGVVLSCSTKASGRP